MPKDEDATNEASRVLIRALSDRIVAAVRRSGVHPAEALVVAVGVAARVLVLTAPAGADALTLRTFDDQLRKNVGRLRRGVLERGGGIGETKGTA